MVAIRAWLPEDREALGCVQGGYRAPVYSCFLYCLSLSCTHVTAEAVSCREGHKDEVSCPT